MPAQEKLSQNEQYLAYLTGAGITIAIVALIMIGLGTDAKILGMDMTSWLLVGLALLVIGVIAWLAIVQPWKSFDDLKTPFYTGHHEPRAPEPAPAPPAAETAVAAQAAPAKAGEPDDLTLIEGIGPKSAEALKTAGITTFAQVAALSPEALEKTVKDQNVRLVGSTETWPQQAALAAAGDLTALEDFRARIKRGVAEDDLTLIEGIGPKSAEALKTAGVTTFAQVAALSPEALEKTIKDQNVRLVGSTETWPQQAALAAAGDLTALEELQSRIKGGALQSD